MQHLVKVVDSWCLENGMVLSSKSVFQWLCTAFRGVNTYLTHVNNVTPVIRITRRRRPAPDTQATRPAASLTLRGGRLVVASSNEDTVEFPTLMKQSHTYLGVVVDYRLRFMDHLTALRQHALEFLTRIDALLPRVHPRIGRSLALAAARSLTYSLPLLHQRVLKDKWKVHRRLGPVRPTILARVSRIVRSAGTADTFIKMGVPSVAMMVTKQAIRFNAVRCSHQNEGLAIYSYLTPDSPPTAENAGSVTGVVDDAEVQPTPQSAAVATVQEELAEDESPESALTHRQLTHFPAGNALQYTPARRRALIDPFAAFGHATLTNLLPYIHPLLPPPDLSGQGPFPDTLWSCIPQERLCQACRQHSSSRPSLRNAVGCTCHRRVVRWKLYYLWPTDRS